MTNDELLATANTIRKFIGMKMPPLAQRYICCDLLTIKPFLSQKANAQFTFENALARQRYFGPCDERISTLTAKHILLHYNIKNRLDVSVLYGNGGSPFCLLKPQAFYRKLD